MKLIKKPLGFTLVEVVVVLAITALLVAGAVVARAGMQKETSFNTSVDQVRNNIVRVQNEAFSGVKDGVAGQGKSNTGVFGKLVEFTPGSNRMVVYTLISQVENENDDLQACDRQEIDLPNQIEYDGARDQAIIFTRASGSIYVTPQNYHFTPTCSVSTYQSEAIYNGVLTPGPGPGPAPPPPPPPRTQCEDGLDNDGDGPIDTADDGCIDVFDVLEDDPCNSGGASGGVCGFMNNYNGRLLSSQLAVSADNSAVINQRILNRILSFIPSAHAAARGPKVCNTNPPCDILEPIQYTPTSDFFTDAGGVDFVFVIQGETSVGYINVDSRCKRIIKRADDDNAPC
jgi:prepilin-type N-terminal cleavage/methylation domain-containing protein